MEAVTQPEEVSRSDLSRGDLEVLGLMHEASNYTLLAKIPALDDLLVVYKPKKGEAPLWDFPQGTLSNREVAAFEICAAAGWDYVPLTVIRDGRYGEGAVQVFYDHDPAITAFDLVEDHTDDLMRIVLLDLIINNADRKAGHVFLDEGGRTRAIDHGVCFHEDPKLRTVLWDWVDQPIPADLKDEIGRLCSRLTRDDELPGLPRLLSPAEVAALKARVEAVASLNRFPPPGPGRPYPWPLI